MASKEHLSWGEGLRSHEMPRDVLACGAYEPRMEAGDEVGAGLSRASVARGFGILF